MIDYYDYYMILCGYYECVVNLGNVWIMINFLLFMNVFILNYIKEIFLCLILFIYGE